MKILITINKNEVAPRFDLASEILIAENGGKVQPVEPRILLLSGTSGEELCSLAIKENIALIICGGIEDNHYQYMMWKKIKVIDRIIGPYVVALEQAMAGKLKPGSILPGARSVNGEHP